MARQALLNALPLSSDVKLLHQAVSRLSGLRYQHHSYLKSGRSTPDGMPEKRNLVADLLHPDSHPVLLARQMLCFAITLQHISPREVIPGLTKRHPVVMHELAETAIKMVTTNDALLGTLEGLEAIFLEGVYHIDCGNIRRAWTTMRRCVAAAQLMGLHRHGHQRYKTIENDSDIDAEALWETVICSERILSLLLGLPTSTCGINPTRSSSANEAIFGQDLTMLLGGVIVRILQRNEIDVAQRALSMTKDIDRELLKIADTMPPSFWKPAALHGLGQHSPDAVIEARRNFYLMCYCTLVVQLHLPHMLCQSDDSEMMYSKIACVNASREILTRDTAVRSFDPALGWRRMSDFLALIAGMTLMLAHATSHCSKRTESILAHQRLSDRAAVERTLQCMETMVEGHEDALAVNCAAVLRDLLKIEMEAAEGHLQGGPYPEGVVEGGSSLHIMRVPYIGSIKISRSGIAAVPPSAIPQDRSLDKDVTLGGIGSIRVSSAALPQHNSSTGISDSAARHAPATDDWAIQRDVISVTQSGLETPFAQYDSMYPDAAAGLDDWMFQGLDTAYFDALLRGLGDQ